MTKTSCPRNNDTPLQCEHGCCGNSSDQKCCSFELSETVIIVTCVVGALIVFISVILLVICITKKKKDAVTRIQPRRRQHQASQFDRRRQMAVEMPKPPPYSEAPPEYNSWNRTNRRTINLPVRTYTEYNRPVLSRSDQSQNIRHSPHPSTSGGTPISIISDDLTHYQVNRRTETRLDNGNENLRHSEEIDNQKDDNHRRNVDGQIKLSQPIPYENVALHETHQVFGAGMERSANAVPTVTQTSNVHEQKHGNKKKNSTELPGIAASLPESPRPTNEAAARRSAKRQAVLQHLESRRMRQFEMSVSSASDDA